ncbi:class I fructose-bisphosphate aldolase [Aeropyrum camini]|uniref:fructose-bisphosphate aldolase n=1 Tax=Aeropyrum camini SY1 = JCM 12091 TaxID=1198449 RepID=U3TBP8_9CREN|nr:class I fructose-bisphosphate aldolase [Aeropyrum camini]BAN89475.1 fructose-bisphosphate aldolase [Aeropyrum camini SY1 = JCM 12091]
MISSQYAGKRVRLSRILPDGKSVIFAFDHGVEHGPGEISEGRLDPRVLIREVVEAGVDAIMTTPGIARMTWDIWANRVAMIIKVSGKTSLRPAEDQLLQSIISSVVEAVALGGDGVAATVYWGSQYEDKMLERWTQIRLKAEELGVPALQLAYPRGPHIKNRYAVDIVAYGARAAMETGADLIKTYYTGSTETFRQVVKAAGGVPVLMSGGARTASPQEFLRKVHSVMEAGGSGVVVGRNVFQAGDIRGMVRAIRAVVHEGADPEEAAKLLDGSGA